MKILYDINQIFANGQECNELFLFAQKNGITLYTAEAATHKGPIKKIVVINPGEERQDYSGDGSVAIFSEDNKIYMREMRC